MSEDIELFRVLTKQHREVDRLLVELAGTDDAEIDRREALYEGVRAKLLSHAKAEEKTFYPALQKAGEHEDAQHARREHREIEDAVKEVDALAYDDPMFVKKVEQLAEIVTHHVEEEEGDLFATARESLGPQDLDRVCERFIAQQKQELAALGVEDNYDELTKEELLEEARELEIPGRSSMSKDELITHLRNSTT